MRNHSSRAARIAFVIASAMVIASAFLGVAHVPATAASSGVSSWTVYHGDASGTGVSTVLKSVSTSKRAWTSPVLSGEIYGEPLVFSNDVFAATQPDNAHALSATPGPVGWRRHPAIP